MFVIVASKLKAVVLVVYLAFKPATIIKSNIIYCKDHMTESGISYQQIENFNTLPFWKKNESFLRELERAQLPPKTRLISKDISNTVNAKENGNLVTIYDMINIYDNRKHFFSIAAEFDPSRSSVLKVEIIAGDKLSNPKKTVIEGSRITNKAHIEWLKEMSRNDVYELFRA